MRLYLKLSKNRELIPFNYQSFLTGALHKWMGKENEEHGNISLYSFSWLQNIDTEERGINLKNGSYFFISAHDDALIKTIVKGIMADSSVLFGASVLAVDVKETPIFPAVQRFEFASPILIRRFDGDKDQHISYDDEKASFYLTESMQRKLALAGLPADNIKVSFDADYQNPRTKVLPTKVSVIVPTCVRLLWRGRPNRLHLHGTWE